MGGGPATETLLFIHNGEEPQHITNSLRTQFPYIDLIFHRYSSTTTENNDKSSSSKGNVPESLWRKATILVTFFVLPPTPDVVPNLRWIQVLSAGIDHLVDQPIYKDTLIPITTVSGIHGPSIAEWVLMTSLSLSKNYNIMHDNQRQHKWDSRSIGMQKRRDWHGKIVGLAGYGGIGRQGTSMNILPCQPLLTRLQLLASSVPWVVGSTYIPHHHIPRQHHVVTTATLSLVLVIPMVRSLKHGTVVPPKPICTPFSPQVSISSSCACH